MAQLLRAAVCFVVLVAPRFAEAQSAGASARTLIPAGAAAPLALTHVTIVGGSETPSRSDMTVVIRRGRIDLVEPSQTAIVPSDAKVVDATGRYVIPGLWDMHVHLAQWPPAVLGLLVANGVTAVRDMGSALTTIDAWRADVASGKRVGPRIVAAGAILDGAGHHSSERIPLPTPEAARRVVDSLADAGAEFVKVYDFLQRDVYRAVLAEAGARKLPVVGHVPRDVGVIAATEAGERSIEHFSGVPLPCPFSMRWAARTPGLSGLMPPCGDDGARAKVFDRFRTAGTWVTPTLVGFRGAARATDASALGEAAEPRMRYVTPALRQHWDEQIAKWPKVVPSSYRRGLTELYGRVTRAAHGAHVSMLAGSDLGNTLVFPGSSLHEELELLVANGLSPLEALRAATSSPARFLGVADSLGAVTAGMIADLVLLDANPLEDIRNVRRIRAVVQAGALLDRDVLDRLASERAPEIDHP